MGVSTDAIAFYGIALTEDEHWLSAFDDWEDEVEMNEDNIYDHLLRTYTVHTDPASMDWKARSEAIKELPFEVVRYQHSDCPQFGLAVRGSVHEAGRGHVVTLYKNMLAVDDTVEKCFIDSGVLDKLWEAWDPEWRVVSFSDY